MLVIFSGSETHKLEDIFGDLPVWLAAENGVFVRPPPEHVAGDHQHGKRVRTISCHLPLCLCVCVCACVPPPEHVAGDHQHCKRVRTIFFMCLVSCFCVCVCVHLFL